MSVQATITSRTGAVLIGLVIVLCWTACDSHHPIQMDVKVSRAQMPVPGQFMTLTKDGTRLVNTITNKPVFMVGDSGWAAITQLSNEDVKKYLADRAARG